MRITIYLGTMCFCLYAVGYGIRVLLLEDLKPMEVFFVLVGIVIVTFIIEKTFSREE